MAGGWEWGVEILSFPSNWSLEEREVSSSLEAYKACGRTVWSCSKHSQMITAWIFQCFPGLTRMCGSDLFSSWKCYRNRKISPFVCPVVSCLCLAGALVWKSCTSLPLCSVLNKSNLEWAPVTQNLPQKQVPHKLVPCGFIVYHDDRVISWRGYERRGERQSFVDTHWQDFHFLPLVNISLWACQKFPCAKASYSCDFLLRMPACFLLEVRQESISYQ